MVESASNSALLFLINTVFDLFLFILMVRIILVYVRANYFDPLTQLITKLTDFAVKPLRRIIPNIYRFETASIVLVIILELIKFSLILSLTVGIHNIMALFIFSFADMIKLLLQTFFYAILIQAIMSWVQPVSMMAHSLYQITQPIMRPFRRLIPPVSGFDVSPIPALILLQVLIILLVNPLMSFGKTVLLS